VPSLASKMSPCVVGNQLDADRGPSIPSCNPRSPLSSAIMGKGDKNQKDKDPALSLNVNSVPNRDIMQRLNFMYQASTLLHSIASGSSERTPHVHPRAQVHSMRISVQSNSSLSRKKVKGTRPRPDKKPRASPKGLGAVARFYAQSLPAVAQRTTVKM
jgi:ribonuclease P protein subunit RPR2